MNKIIFSMTTLFLIFLSGCSTPNATDTTEPSVQQRSTPTLTPSPTGTPSFATPTDVPTLPAEDARQRLLALLANNNDCRLPCLWGITPGKSSYLNARAILLPLRGIAETAYFDFTSSPVDDISPLYVESDLRLKTRIAYVYDNDDVVSYIVFRAVEQQLSKDEYGNQLTTPIFDSPTFLKRVQYYSLSHVLSEQGVPESVLIATSGGPLTRGGTGGFDIVLLYPKQGVFIEYTMEINFLGVNVGGCPRYAYINLFLVPPGNPTAFFSLLDKTDWGLTKAGYSPLEEATSMSIEQFYETFRQPTDQCIETPSNLWPTPER